MRSAYLYNIIFCSENYIMHSKPYFFCAKLDKDLVLSTKYIKATFMWNPT